MDRITQPLITTSAFTKHRSGFTSEVNVSSCLLSECFCKRQRKITNSDVAQLSWELFGIDVLLSFGEENDVVDDESSGGTINVFVKVFVRES